MSLFAHDGIPLLLLVIVSKPKHLSRDEGKERNAKDCFFIIIIIAFPFFFQVRKKRNQGCNWYGFRWDVPKKNRDRKERADMGCILFDTFGVVGDLRLETPSIRSIRWGALGCGSEPGCICGFVWRGGGLRLDFVKGWKARGSKRHTNVQRIERNLSCCVRETNTKETSIRHGRNQRNGSRFFVTSFA